MCVAHARMITGEQARSRVRVQHVPGGRAGAPPRARREAREMRGPGGGGGGGGGGRVGWMLRARRTDPQDSSSRLLSAASTSETASLASATAAAANARRTGGQTLGMCAEARSRLEVLGGAGHLVIPRDQVSEQLGYHPNDFLGRSNAHHLEFRHRGPSPSKGSALRAASSLLSSAGGHSLGHAWHGPAHGQAGPTSETSPAGN